MRSATDMQSNQDIPVLSMHAQFYAFMFLRRRKYSATRLSKAQSIGASLVQVRFTDIDNVDSWTWCGVIEDLVGLTHQGQAVVLAHMRWLVPWKGESLDEWNI